MPTNDFIGFASAGSANIMSQADYAAAYEQLVGVQPGMASSALANKAWRQGANMAAVIGELIKNHGNDALDNGDLATLYNALLSATASPTLAGLMSAADKNKLDGLISTDATQSAAGYMSAADKTKLDGLISTDATQSAAGYMSAADKTKLDGLISTDATQSAAGYMSAADKTRLDSVILTNATQTAAGYMSAADKTKLDALLPVGTILFVAGNTVPDRCLAAYGATVSRTTYAKLFAAIGTTWGKGDGRTTFTLPDARGRVPWGSDSLHVGTYYSAGLPNITGTASWIIAGGYSDPTGAFYWKIPHFDKRTSLYIETNNSNADLAFDASKSNSIYGGSTTVQPPALCLLPCIVYE